MLALKAQSLMLDDGQVSWQTSGGAALLPDFKGTAPVKPAGISVTKTNTSQVKTIPVAATTTKPTAIALAAPKPLTKAVQTVVKTLTPVKASTSTLTKIPAPTIKPTAIPANAKPGITVKESPAGTQTLTPVTVKATIPKASTPAAAGVSNKWLIILGIFFAAVTTWYMLKKRKGNHRSHAHKF